MTRPASSSQPTPRRERRASERVAARPRRPARRRPFWRSPVFVITGAMVVVGLALIAGQSVLHPSRPSTADLSASIVVPADLPPADLTAGRGLGRPDAPVTLTVWSDFPCPASRMLAVDVEPRLVTDYVSTGRLRIEYRDLVVIGPESSTAAAASRCAADQDRFWDCHGVLFANQLAENSGGLDRARLVAMAEALHLDRPAFDACLDGGHATMAIQAESSAAMATMHSTPTLDFGSMQISGVPGWDALSAQIDALLAAAGA